MTDRLPQHRSWIDAPVGRRGALAGAALAGYALAAEPLLAQAVTTDARGLDAGMVQVPTAGIRMNAYRAKPAARTRAPVVLVVQEIFGLHEWIRDICRRLAKAGYYAIAPDMYQRQGDPTKAPDMKTLFETIVSRVPDAQVMADLDATAAFAGTDGGDAARLGVTGFCWGGRVTWLYAAHQPRLKAGVAWYGRLTGKPSALTPTHPIDVAARLHAPVLGLYGTRDKGIPVADVEAMNAALKAAGEPSEIRLFDADHGFLADYRPSYSPTAAPEAWSQALAWFRTL